MAPISYMTPGVRVAVLRCSCWARRPCSYVGDLLQLHGFKTCPSSRTSAVSISTYQDLTLARRASPIGPTRIGWITAQLVAAPNCAASQDHSYHTSGGRRVEFKINGQAMEQARPCFEDLHCETMTASPRRMTSALRRPPPRRDLPELDGGQLRQVRLDSLQLDTVHWEHNLELAHHQGRVTFVSPLPSLSRLN